MRCGRNGLEQEPRPLGVSAKLARQCWRTRTTSYHCHRHTHAHAPPPPPPRAPTEVLLFLFSTFMRQAAIECTRKKTKKREDVNFLGLRVGFCCRGNSRPHVLLLFSLPLKFKDVIGDALVDVRAPGGTPVRDGTRTCTPFALFAAIKLR